MIDLENGMVIGADREWERLNMGDVLDNMGDEQVVEFMQEEGYEVNVFAELLGLDDSVKWDEDEAALTVDKLVHGGVIHGWTSWADMFAKRCRDYIRHNGLLSSVERWAC